MGQVFGKRPRVVVDDVVDQDRPVKRPAIAPDAFLRVLGSSEGLTNVLRFTGASSVLALETLSTRAREMIRRGSIEFESSMDERYRASIYAYRHELFAIRRAGGFESGDAKLRKICTYDFHGFSELSGDVWYGADGLLRIPSPRRPPAVPTPAADDVDVPRSVAHRDALERTRKALLNTGLVILDVTAHEDDRVGLAAMRRLQRSMSSHEPPDDGVDAAFSAKMVEAMGGAGRLPSRLLKAATRDYGGCGGFSRLSFLGPRHLEALFASTAKRSAYADARTLERVSDAYCRRVFLGPDAADYGRMELGEDEATFLEVCRDAGVPPGASRGLWREALGGLLCPFVPKSNPGNYENWKGNDLVRRGDQPRVQLHFTFVHACCARAIVARARGDPLLCFARDRDAQLHADLPTHHNTRGSLALEVLDHLRELRGGAAKVEAALAAVTSEERLPCLAAGDKVRVAMNWREAHLRNDVIWSKATYLRRLVPWEDADTCLGHTLLVRYDEGDHAGTEAEVFSFGVQRDIEEMPVAASLLCAAAADGRNELLVRLLEAPAFAELALGFASPDVQTTALDQAIENANVVGAAILVAKRAFAPSVCAARRFNHHTSPKLSAGQKSDLLSALSLAGKVLDDPRWSEPDDDPSAFEAAAAAGDVATVRRMSRKGSFRERVYSLLWREPAVAPMSERRALKIAARRGHVDVVREMLRPPNFVANFWRDEAIEHAAVEGHADCVEALLAGAGTEDRVSDVIRRSVRCGHAHVLRRLRHLGYSLLVEDGESPLQMAAYYGQHATCAVLCEDPDVAAALRGMTCRSTDAVRAASAFGQHEVLRVLLETAQLSSFDAYTEQSPFPKSEGGQFEETINVLLDYGFPIDYAADGMMTALGCAASTGHYATAALLLLRGASVTAGKGQNALMCCVSAVNARYHHMPDGRLGMARLLINERREECIESFGPVIIFAIAVRSNAALIELLLKTGADPSFVESSSPGFTALHWAVVRLVEAELGSDEDAKKLAVEHLRLLVNYGASFEIPTTGEYTSDQHALTVPSGATPRDIPLYCENEQTRINVFAAIDAAVAARDSSQP